MRRILLLLTIALGSTRCMAQEDLAQHWETYRRAHLEEKVFVHTDKDFYLAGEVCWFKCYDVSALTNKPLSFSRVGYVEILDTAGKPALQGKIALTAGSGAGSFYLPFTLPSGVYTLRAYTSWMKNEPAGYFFHKKITIVNTRLTAPVPAAAVAGNGVFVAFPEGGNLVDGLPSTVAFKGTDNEGQPFDFTGVILDEKNDSLVGFTSRGQGLGRFDFTPVQGHNYHALVHPLSGQPDFSVPLPDAYPSGFVMHLDTSADGQLIVTVQTNKAGEDKVYLLVHTRGSLKIAEAQTLQDGRVVFHVDKNKLGDGVSHLTVFNNARQPVCERLYFKYPSDGITFSLDADRASYGAREAVNLRLRGVDSADLSMAVYRLDSLQGADPTNIRTYLWLTSDLAGPISSPEYYFDRPLAMDDLMLTQGWRRFRWESVLGDSTPSFTYPPELMGHIVSGTIVDTRTGKPGVEMEGWLSVPGKRSLVATTRSDSSGRVAFEMRNMFGSSEIIVQTNLLVDSLYRIDVDDPFSEVYPRYTYPSFQEPLKNPVTITEHSLSMQVQNAYAAMRVQQPQLPDLDSTAFYLTPDLTYKLDDYTRFTTMEEVLREYIQLVNVSRRGVHYHLWTYDAPHASPFADDPMIFLDGVPIFNTDQFMLYDPFKIRKVDVMTRRWFMGSTFYDGLVNWVTYRGDLSGYQLDPHAVAVDYGGLQDKREFYSPAYATDAQKASRLPDFRNVLYWNPDAGTARERFYTSDLPGRYLIVVQGITPGGVPLYATKVIDVK